MKNAIVFGGVSRVLHVTGMRPAHAAFAAHAAARRLPCSASAAPPTRPPVRGRRHHLGKPPHLEGHGPAVNRIRGLIVFGDSHLVRIRK